VGTARALRWILLAEKIEAPELASLGVVMKVVPAHELREATLAVAREIEKGPPLAFAEIRRSVYGSWGDIAEALRREREGQLRCLRSQDAMNGIAAWATKQEPAFEGR
jgi:enoyl-CoA hydratase/carnithine racemase